MRYPKNQLIGVLMSGLVIYPFIFDNGIDLVSDGYVRIVDDQGRVGYADTQGVIKIQPQFAFGFPFKEGVARVTTTGKLVEVPGSDGEYHRWESDAWFCINKKGAVVDHCPGDPVR
jgi:hypothetical protein